MQVDFLSARPIPARSGAVEHRRACNRGWWTAPRCHGRRGAGGRIDEGLWTGLAESFLPHGREGADQPC